MTASSNPWQFFEKVYCISIRNRTDRQDAAKKQFAAVGLLPQVEFILVEKHPQNPEEGIFRSHMRCLQKGIEAGAANILIFEDDVCFHGFNRKTLAEAADFLNTTPHWNAFFAGAITGSVQKTASPAVAAVSYRCLAHAYAVNRPFAMKFCRNKWSNIPYDTLLRQQNQHFFALHPMIAFQSNASTDNKTFFIDKTRRLFGGLRFLQKLNEFYQHHKRTVISVHIFIIFLLLVFAWKYLQNQ